MCGSRCVLLLCILLLYVLFINANTGLQEYCPSNKDIPKYCLLRTLTLDQQIWNYFAGFYCYNYTNGARLNFKYAYTTFPILCQNKNSSLPVAIVNNYTYAFFDYTNSTSMDYIRKSFKTETLFSNYIKCSIEAEECCLKHMSEDYINSNETHCPAIWDAWSCFPPTKVNTTETQPCSSQAYQSPDHVCRLDSRKDCLWSEALQTAYWVQQTNYTVCAIAPVYRRRHRFHTTLLLVCIVLSIPAIVIFFLFEKMRKTIRVILHRNLLMAICVRNIFTILSKELVIMDALKSSTDSKHVMENNTVFCRILAFFESSAKNCIYACMLVDGFYLHKVIVRTFAREIKMVYLYATVTVFTLLPSLMWATAMGVVQVENCWMVDFNGLQWITDAFRITILSVNTFLLFDILRVMILKLRQGTTTRQTRAALRATLLLTPLFGVHIIVTAKKIVYDDSCLAEDIYDYARYTMEGLQGIFVSILFCYANTEVHNEIRNGFRKISIFLSQRFRWNFGRSQTRRRTTAATFIQHESNV